MAQYVESKYLSYLLRILIELNHSLFKRKVRRSVKRDNSALDQVTCNALGTWIVTIPKSMIFLNSNIYKILK